MKQRDYYELLRWRTRGLPLMERDAEGIADSLSVEGMRYVLVTAKRQAQVTAFRHLRQDARVRTAKAYLETRR